MWDTGAGLDITAMSEALCGVVADGQALCSTLGTYYLTSSSQRLSELGIIIPISQTK